MNCRININKDVVVLTPQGELNVYTISQLKEMIDQKVKGGYGKFIIDLKDVSYMDSSALGVLINLVKGLQKKGGGLKIVNLKGNIERIFRLTRLVSFFDTYATKEEALSSFQI